MAVCNLRRSRNPGTASSPEPANRPRAGRVGKHPALRPSRRTGPRSRPLRTKRWQPGVRNGIARLGESWKIPPLDGHGVRGRVVPRVEFRLPGERLIAQSTAMRAWIRAGGALAAAFAMALALVAPDAAAQGAAQAAKKKKPTFGFEDVAKRAEKLARSSYKDPRGEVPDWLLQISYDQWRDIRFKPESSMWRGKNSNFEVQFFHAGLFYDRTVQDPRGRFARRSRLSISTRTSSTTARTTSRAACRRTSASPASASTTRSSRPATRTR